MTFIPYDAAVVQFTCEAGLFDSSFACDVTDTTRCQVNGCVVHLCAEHRNVITIRPTATPEA